MLKRVPLETKSEILEKVKNGMTVPDTARQYAISDKPIYGWIANQTKPEISLLEFNRLKKKMRNSNASLGSSHWS